MQRAVYVASCVPRPGRPVIFFDDVRHQTHVVPHQLIFGGAVALLRQAQALRLFGGRQRLGEGALPPDRPRKKGDLAQQRKQKIEQHAAFPPIPFPVPLLYEGKYLYHAGYIFLEGK